jgi:hypothetical protein
MSSPVREVEVTGRFVGEQNRRIHRQGAGDGDALPFAARQFVGEVRQPMIELDEGQQFTGARVHFGARPASQVQRQADVFERCQSWQQVEELEDESDFVAPDASQGIVREATEPFAVDDHVSGCGAVESADQVEQGGFARARRSDDRDQLAAGDGEADGVEGGDVAFACELLADAVEGNHRPIM